MTTSITTFNPTTGESLQTYESWSASQIEQAVDGGYAAAKAWGKQPLSVRVEVVRRLADELRRQSAKFADLVTVEMGKVKAEAAGELEKSAVTATYYADNAARILADEKASIDGVDAWVSYEPIGLVLAVMPWNFPVWQVMRFAIPAITAGNGVLLKHSPNVTGCALALEELFVDAGLPKGVVTTMVVAEPDVPEVIDRLIQDDRIAAVTLTGSNRAGAAVGAAAGRASKKSVLELGGSDAFIVLDDADVPAAAVAAVKARYHNAGQSCVCAKRFIVSEGIAKEFTKRFVDGARALVVGDPGVAGTQMGPLARGDLRDALDRQVRRSLEAGAVLLAGGQAIEGPGNFYEPTVLGNTGPGMAVFDEETFGPLAAIAIAKDDADAIRLANATPFGLSVSVWSSSTERALTVAKGVTSGAAFINSITASDARVPFGGTKKSGYGRELASAGIREFTNTRTYWSVSVA
ncbi:aldehyde dehydrogenase family protein [Ralstonia pseudosolanacearum]|uniref:aldehyde dehydrogenase family protein n=1 Tax=Ralstonia pseudosolanacearum TaxID=1310165 RepID=UPI001C8C110A|nr:aldehyde dehydrogenase family protein [Ralstonia pseudosolanacearum]MBX9431649.1 aldehyde dehydrogenase family protein [Ralstonia pseudosolanacearum]